MGVKDAGGTEEDEGGTRQTGRQAYRQARYGLVLEELLISDRPKPCWVFEGHVQTLEASGVEKRSKKKGCGGLQHGSVRGGQGLESPIMWRTRWQRA